VISAFVASYGYFAVFAGTLLEGETILVAAGFAAHRGLLNWPLVVLVAVIGATIGDQAAFLAGRWKGEALLQRFPRLARHRSRVCDLLRRYDAVFILTVRFLYGLRIAGPVLLGASGVPALRFAAFNVLGAMVWATAVSGAGYGFGLAIGALVDNLKRVEEIAFAGILAAGAALWSWHWLRGRRRDRPGAAKHSADSDPAG
jgi:membrane protein DedA with SNARE-associated domain